jgi:hypothetical protein
MIFYIHGLHKLEDWIGYLQHATALKYAKLLANAEQSTSRNARMGGVESAMKTNPTEKELESFEYGANTMSCIIPCLPHVIRERAYQLFEARGGEPGLELDDWLQAEREIKHHFSL